MLIAVVGFVGSIASFITLAADFVNRPIKEWKPLPRALVPLSLLAVSIITVFLYPKSDTNTTSAATTTITTRTPPVAVETTVSTTPLVAANVSPSKPIPAPQPVRVAPRPESTPAPAIRITDEHGRLVPELVVIARQIRPHDTMIGDLRETIEQSPELQNLYTARLTLTVSITREHEVIDAFTLRTRGGGFQEEAARAQAHERLVQALKQRLAESP